MPKLQMPANYHKWKYKVRDVSAIFQGLRQFLLGRQHTLHGRFTPLIAPRTIPTADVTRNMNYKYAKHPYYKRATYNSVYPPVVAPVAQGRRLAHDEKEKFVAEGIKPELINFPCGPPTPGLPWWWDGHFYYECIQMKPIPTDCKTTNLPPNPHSIGRKDT